MKFKKALIIALGAIMSLAAVSCDKAEENTVPDLPVLSTEADTTEESTTEAEIEVTTEASTEAETEAETTTAETTTEAEETTEAPTEEATEEETEAEPEPEEPEPSPEPQNVTFSFDTLHSEAGGIISALGEPVNVTTAPACFSNGADSKIYTYDGIVIECYVLDGVEKINCVTITSSNYSTDTGITIGSSQADVEAIYGAGEAAGAYTIYYSGEKELDVKYDGGAAAELVFYTIV